MCARGIILLVDADCLLAFLKYLTTTAKKKNPPDKPFDIAFQLPISLSLLSVELPQKSAKEN